MKRAINVLSLFDGMSCGQIALQEAEIKVDKYFASEIDKYTIEQTQHNFPNTIQLGDVTKVKAKDLPKIDLLIGGSPCQGFSFAGAGLNFDDPRSALFFEYVRILKELKEVNPDIKFLLENVNMKREHLGVISKYLEIYPARINSNLVSAQNRDRFYWTNIRTRKEGFFDELWSDIPQPKDRCILLKDILQPEIEVDEKYYLKDKSVLSLIKWGKRNKANGNGFKPEIRTGDDKSTTITTGSFKSSSTFIKLDKNLKPKPNQDKASTFTAGGNSGGNHSDMDIICVAMRGRNPENSNDRTPGAPTEQRLEPKEDGKTNCLTSVAKDNLILQIPEATKKGYAEIKPRECADLENKNSKTRRGRKMDDKSNSLMSQGMHFHKFTEDYKLRRLTPTECARLQTIPGWYKWIVSDTQIYRMLGNGWTVEVIKHILLS